MKRAFSITYVYKDSTFHFLLIAGKRIGDHHNLVAEILAIRKAIVTIIHKELAEVIITSDSLVAVKAINGGPPIQIRNLVEHIKSLANVIQNIKFVYCSRSANELANMIAKKAHICLT